MRGRKPGRRNAARGAKHQARPETPKLLFTIAETPDADKEGPLVERGKQLNPIRYQIRSG